MRSPLAIALLLCAGCAGSDESVQDSESTGDALDNESSEEIVDLDVRIDVVPADQREADGDIRALPQVFGPYRESALDDAPLALALERPITVRGVVTGLAVSPYSGLGSLPTVEGPAPGRVRLVHSSGFTAYDVPTDPVSGAYALDVVPGTYEVLATPDSVRMAPDWANYRIDDAADGPVDEHQVLREEHQLLGDLRAVAEQRLDDPLDLGHQRVGVDLRGVEDLRAVQPEVVGDRGQVGVGGQRPEVAERGELADGVVRGPRHEQA